MTRAGQGLFALAALAAMAGGERSAAADVRAPPFADGLAEAERVARTAQRPLVAVFVAVWCPVCERMRREVLGDPAVLAYGDEFAWARIDIDRNLTTARTLGVEAVPTVVFYDAGGREVGRRLGLGTAETLAADLARLREAGDPDSGTATTPLFVGPRSDIIYTPTGYRAGATCFSNAGYGPLRLYSQSPFQPPRLGIRPRTPATLGRGEWEFAITSTWANVWALDGSTSTPDPDYFLDYETLQNVLALSYGATDAVSLGAELALSSRFGGVMDSLVQGFHDLLGIDQGGRDEVAKGGFTIGLEPGDGRPSVALGESERGTFSHSAQFSVQHNVTCGGSGWPALSVSGIVRLETADEEDLVGGDRVDLGLSMSLSKRFAPVYVYGTLGYAWLGSDDFRGLPLEETQFTVLGAVEWRLASRLSLLLQVLASQGAVRDFGPFSEFSTEMTVGAKWEPWRRHVFEFGLIENVLTFDNGPDFGVHVGYARRF